jgi:hypothetical protein
VTVTRWIGRAVLAIGVLHTVVGVSMFRSTLAELAAEGFVNTVHGQPMREWAFWFLFFGFLGILAGALIDWCEQSPRPLPGFLGLGLLAITVTCVTLMPVSGGWLLLAPSVGALLHSRTGPRTVRA